MAFTLIFLLVTSFMYGPFQKKKGFMYEYDDVKSRLRLAGFLHQLQEPFGAVFCQTG